MSDILSQIHPAAGTPGYPHAPSDWSEADAQRLAAAEGLALGPDHWELLRALQSYFASHEVGDFRPRELHDALDEHFHRKGGIKYLYGLFPGGPVAQGCRLAGLPVPTGAIDRSFGSVQ